MINSLFDCRQNLQEEISKEKKKKRMSFEAFNQYREIRLISNESDASLTQKASAKREIIENDIFRKRDSVCHEEDCAILILRDDVVSTSVANVTLLIDHYARVKDFRSVSFRRIQYYEIS